MPDVIAGVLALVLLLAALVLVFDVFPYLLGAAFKRAVSDPLWNWRSKRRQRQHDRQVEP